MRRAVSPSGEIMIAAAIALAAALAVGVLAVTQFPTNESVTTHVAASSNTATTQTTYLATTTTASTSVRVSNESGPAPGQEGPPVLLGGYLFAQNVSCSLTTGACIMLISNQSTTPLLVVSCQILAATSVNNGVAQSVTVNGTIGGQVAGGIPAGAEVVATCTIPASQLSYQAKGSIADGSFVVKLIDSVPSESMPAGAETSLGFEGSWSDV